MNVAEIVRRYEREMVDTLKNLVRPEVRENSKKPFIYRKNWKNGTFHLRDTIPLTHVLRGMCAPT